MDLTDSDVDLDLDAVDAVDVVGAEDVEDVEDSQFNKKELIIHN